MNKITNNILLGVSTLIGFIVAGSIYKTGARAVEDRMLIGDAEVTSEEMVEEES